MSLFSFFLANPEIYFLFQKTFIESKWYACFFNEPVLLRISGQQTANFYIVAVSVINSAEPFDKNQCLKAIFWMLFSK